MAAMTTATQATHPDFEFNLSPFTLVLDGLRSFADRLTELSGGVSQRQQVTTLTLPVPSLLPSAMSGMAPGFRSVGGLAAALASPIPGQQTQSGEVSGGATGLEDGMNAITQSADGAAKALAALEAHSATVTQNFSRMGVLGGVLQGLQGMLGKMGAFGEIGNIALTANRNAGAIDDAYQEQVSKINAKAAAGQLNDPKGAKSTANDQKEAAQAANIALAATQSFVVILQRSEQFKTAVSILEHAADILAGAAGKAFEPFLAAFYVMIPLVNIVATIFQALAPILDFFGRIIFETAKWLGVAIGGIVIAINAAIYAIEWLAYQALSAFNYWGGTTKELANGIKQAMDASLGAIDASVKNTEALVNTSFEGAKDKAKEFKDATGEMAHSLNELSGYVSARAKYDAAQAGQIPHHAAGGTVWAPEIALIGESGPEDIVPHSKRGAYVQQLLGSTGGGGSHVDNSTSVHIELHGAIIKANDPEQLAKGVMQVSGGEMDSLGLPFGGAPRFVGA